MQAIISQVSSKGTLTGSLKNVTNETPRHSRSNSSSSSPEIMSASVSRASSTSNLRSLTCHAKKLDTRLNDQLKELIEPSDDEAIDLGTIKPEQPQLSTMLGRLSGLSRLSRPLAEQVLSGDITGFTSNSVEISPTGLPKMNVTSVGGERINVNCVSIMPFHLPMLEGGFNAAMVQIQNDGEPLAMVEVGALIGIRIPNHSERVIWNVGVAVDKDGVKPFIKAEIATQSQNLALRLNLTSQFKLLDAVVTIGEKQPLIPNQPQVTSERSKNVNVIVSPESLKIEMRNIIQNQLQSVAGFFKF